jgi:hypothetical protein
MTRIVGLGLAVVVLGASSTDGQRANTGWCPEGEQCADDTPEGLSFEGAQVSWFIGNGLIPTAVGGTQTVRITDKATEALFELPFVTNATNPEAHRTSVVGLAQARIAADAEGTGYLRIARVEDGYLFDRVAIESKPIARAEVRSTIAERWPRLEESPFALWAGGDTELSVALLDGADGWLADESLSIGVIGAQERVAWDAMRLEVPTTMAAVPVAIEAAGGAFVGNATVRVVNDLTSVDAFNTDGDRTVGSEQEVCFSAHVDALDVLGVDWVFDLTGPVAPAPAAEQLHPNCLLVTFTGPGTATVTASVIGLSATTTYNVTSSAARVVERPVWPWAGDRREPGERALRSE